MLASRRKFVLSVFFLIQSEIFSSVSLHLCTAFLSFRIDAAKVLDAEPGL